MADEQAPVAGNDGASQPREVASPVDQSNAQPEAGKSVSDRAGSRRDDLSNHPQFRQMQSEYQQRLAKQEREIQQLRQATEQIATKDMTQAEREEYQRSREYQEFMTARQEFEAQRREYEAAMARQQDILRLARRSGAPVDVLDQAQTFEEAEDIAFEWAKKTALQQAEALSEAQRAKREANSVDVGGGKASTPDDDWTRQYREAKESKDPVELMRLAYSRPK